MIEDKEFKKAWVEALRSGRFVQIIGRSCRDLLEQEKANGYEAAVCAIGAGNRVAQKMGFGGKFFCTMAECQAIVCMNDDQRKPFSYIADHIEQNL